MHCVGFSGPVQQIKIMRYTVISRNINEEVNTGDRVTVGRGGPIW